MPTARRTAILAVLLVAAGSLAFATGAAVLDGEADTLADDRVAIQPADGPNGKYAYLNEDDEITVDVSPTNPNLSADFEGVNVGSTGRIDDVFRITYTADETADVWIEHAGENLTFVTDDGPIENASNAVTLGPNGSVSVGLRFDTRGAEAGTYLSGDEFAIHANVTDPETAENAAFSAESDGDSSGPRILVADAGPSARELEASDVDPGDTLRFETGGMAIDRANLTLDRLDLHGVTTRTVRMSADGTPDPLPEAGPLETPQDPVPLGYLALEYDFDPTDVEEMAIRFSIDRDALGDTDPENVVVFRRSDDGGWEPRETAVLDEETVEVSGLSEDRVHFVARTTEFSTFAVAAHTDRIGVRNAAIAESALEAGDETTVTATVENAGGAAGERTLTLTADGGASDGEALGSETVSLAPGESTTVAFPVGFDEDGAYDLAVDGTSAGTLLVGDGTGSSDGTTQAATDGGPQPDADGGSQADADGGSQPDADDGSASPAADEPVEEPGGFGVLELAGLMGVLAVLLGWLAVIRRLPRS
ncbi:DUF1102 domain-containing protein [Halorubrum aethiopicum]|uniref:DUF1102 domain-containing protein n=1 Tax=Halorubrum aethiopicum TaxID=1758255 RepID=UPI000830A116|nr:DUF1102 domain-containing protein [Halorubrum aethiopicum]